MLFLSFKSFILLPSIFFFLADFYQEAGLPGAIVDVVVVEFKNMHAYLGNAEGGQLCCNTKNHLNLLIIILSFLNG